MVRPRVVPHYAAGRVLDPFVGPGTLQVVVVVRRRMAKVRVSCASCVDDRARAALIAALEAAGFAVAGEADAARMPCVIAFATQLAEAVGMLRGRCLLFDDRVLAIAIQPRVEGDVAVQLMGAGASEVLAWHGEIATIAARLERWLAIDELLASDAVARTLIGTSAAWRRVLRELVEVARFTDAPVLVMGDTGTGKELVSRLVHALDARDVKRDLVVVDCTTIVPELSGSEFFGHEKGSFTGAMAARNGAFALADEGTLFLDEVGELPLLLQAELLRVVQEHTYKRVGGSVWQSTRFRLVCATNRDLEVERRDGRFRSDLFYRIAGWTFHLPTLAERREDILPLARHFLGEQLGEPPEIDDAVAEYLMRREFRGNIRELRQLCARIAHRHVGPGPITFGDLGRDLACDAPEETWCDLGFHRAISRAVEMGVGLKEIGRVAEDAAVQLAVSAESGSLQNAARRLGVTDRALQLRRASARGTQPLPPANGTPGDGKSA
jgi:transcriptional regulator with GAF, ATPase, and Fis domain